MSYASDRGLVIGSKIKYIGNKSHHSEHSVFAIGDVLTLDKDDNTVTPYFINQRGNRYAFDLSDRGWEHYQEEVSPFFGKRYKVDPETSGLLQKAVFAAGGDWGFTLGNPKTTKYLTEKYLFVDEIGTISYGGDSSHFNAHYLPEGIIEVEKTVKLISVIPVKTQEQKDYEEALAQFELAKAKLEKLNPSLVK